MPRLIIVKVYTRTRVQSSEFSRIAPAREGRDTYEELLFTEPVEQGESPDQAAQRLIKDLVEYGSILPTFYKVVETPTWVSLK
jgi:hypothetical protein